MNKILRNCAVVGLLFVPFIPFIVSNSLYFPFITGKGFTFRILVEILVAIWAVLAITDSSYRPKKSWIFYSFSIFTFVILLADAFGVFPYKSFWSNNERMEGWILLVHLFAYFVVLVTVLNKEKLWNWLFSVMFVADLFMVGYGFMQLFKVVAVNQGVTRLDATLGNPTYLAIFCLFHIFLAILVAVSPKLTFLPGIRDNQNVGEKWAIASILILLNFVILFNTQTRGSMLGLLGGLFVAGIMVAIKEKNNKKLKYISVGIIAGVVIIVGGFIAIRKTSFVQNNETLARFANISFTERTTLSRFAIWDMAFQSFKERPILGWGQENFNYAFNKNYDPKLWNQEQWFDRTHNVILDWLIVGGVFGLGAYLFFFGSVIWYVLRKKGENFSVLEKATLLGLLVGYFIHNLFVFDNLISYILFIIVAGYVYERTKTNGHEKPAEYKNRVVAPVAVVCLIVAIYALNVRPILADQNLIKAMSEDTSAGVQGNTEYFKKALSYGTFADPEIREQIFSTTDGFNTNNPSIPGLADLNVLAKQEGEIQIKRTPNDARYFVIYGAYTARTGDLKRATELFERALELSPKKQSIIFGLASFAINEKNYPKALNYFKQAYELDKNYEMAQYLYAASAVYAGQNSLADTILSDKTKSAIASNESMLQAYYDTKQYTKLIDLLNQKIADNPTDAQVHITLASAYFAAGNKTKSVEEIKTAAILAPAFASTSVQVVKDIWAGKNPFQ